MSATRRAVGLGALAAFTATAAGGGRGALAASTSAPSGYSVSGKKGPFVKQVAGRPALGGGGGAGGGSLGLTDAISLGRYQAARIRMPQTEGVTAQCKPVQSAARSSGSSYAATNMGLGGAADCKTQ